jgi:hypothetical protein
MASIDTSIYGRLNQVQQPSIADSMNKAMSLKQLAMQNQRAEKTARTEDYNQKISVVGNAMESLAGMKPEQRAVAYPEMRNRLQQAGMIDPNDSPEQYDDGWFQQSYSQFQNTKEYLERQKTKAEIAHLYAQDKAKTNPAKTAFEQLPPENQKQIETLSQGTAKKTSIKNQIDSALTILDDPEVSETQKIVIGQQLLKTLNSSEGADAVGAEESKRLGSLLENKVFNFRQPGSVFGRDLGEFVNQVKLTSGALGQAVDRNKAEIDRLYGRSGGAISQIQIPDTARNKAEKPGSNEAHAAEPSNPHAGTVKMMGPDGQIRYIPKELKGEAIAAGGKVVK